MSDYGRSDWVRCSTPTLKILNPCLLTDTSHLAPGACYTADLKLLALSTGILSVDAVRVVDLATNETSDVRDLPTVVVVEGEVPEL